MEERFKFWGGWVIEEDFLVDPTGNYYHRDEIRAIFFTNQLTRELRGSDLKVRSLKMELEKKLELLEPPVVIIQWPSHEIRLSYPFKTVK